LIDGKVVVVVLAALVPGWAESAEPLT
jgi:hypothetical protein